MLRSRAGTGAILVVLADVQGTDPVASARDTHEMFREFYVKW